MNYNLKSILIGFALNLTIFSAYSMDKQETTTLEIHEAQELADNWHNLSDETKRETFTTLIKNPATQQEGFDLIARYVDERTNDWSTLTNSEKNSIIMVYYSFYRQAQYFTTLEKIYFVYKYNYLRNIFIQELKQGWNNLNTEDRRTLIELLHQANKSMEALFYENLLNSYSQ